MAEITFRRRGATTALAHLYQHDPCRVLFPRPEPDDPVTAVLLTTSGGLTGGDRMHVLATAEAGAEAIVTTQAAEKIYRSPADDCTMSVRVDVAAQATLEWLPQETILFDGARLRRRTELHVAEGGRALACEMIVFGRTARGERFSRGLLQDSWRVVRAGRLAWADALLIDDPAVQLARAMAWDGALAMASVLYVADDAAAQLEPARALVDACAEKAGVTLVNGVLVARFFGRDAAIVRWDLVGYVGGLRQAALRRPERLPRVWYH